MMQFCVERLEPRTLFVAVQPGFSETLFASALIQPTAMEFAPDGRLFVSAKGGTLRVVKDGQLLPTPFVTLPVETSGEYGLFGMESDPSFAVTGYVYIYRTISTPYVHNGLSRYTADPVNPDVALPD